MPVHLWCFIGCCPPTLHCIVLAVILLYKTPTAINDRFITLAALILITLFFNRDRPRICCMVGMRTGRSYNATLVGEITVQGVLFRNFIISLKYREILMWYLSKSSTGYRDYIYILHFLCMPSWYLTSCDMTITKTTKRGFSEDRRSVVKVDRRIRCMALHDYYTSPSHWCTTHEVSKL